MKYKILLFFLLLSNFLFSEKIIIIHNNKDIYFPVSDYIYLLEDSTGKYTMEQIILTKNDSDFIINNKTLNFGFSKSVYWLKFSVINQTPKIKNIIFSLRYPLISSIEFVGMKGSHLVKYLKTGSNYPFNSRDINNRNFLFNLELKPYEKYTYYVRITGEGTPLRLPMQISSYSSYLTQDSNDLILNGIFIGGFFFVILFNLIILFMTGDRLYIYYTIYVMLLILFLSSISGLAYQYLWPNNLWLSKHSSSLFAGLANIFLILFAKRFFNFKKFFRKLNILTRALLSIIVLIIILNLFNGKLFPVSVLLVNMISLVTIISLTGISIIGLKRKNMMHLYFVASFIFFLIGVGIYVFNNLGYYQNNELASWWIKIGFLAEVLTLMIAVMHRYRNIENQSNKELERQVQERTKKLTEQKEKLIEQKEEMITQRDKILNQHRQAIRQSTVINRKNKEINDSIAYAKIIQSAVLSPAKSIRNILNEYFVINLPKDTLGGDFYWVYKKDDFIYVAVADCTGHGIPGAMISMLGITALNEIMTTKKNISPADILNKLSRIVTQSLHQKGKTGEIKDGMDISICRINEANNEFCFAGANNPIYIYRDSDKEIEDKDFIVKYFFEDQTLVKLKPEKKAIGYNLNKNLIFTDKKIKLIKGDMIYAFSDGFADQFGGPKKKKFKLGPFRSLLAENAIIKDTNKQRQHLLNKLRYWKGDNEQVDDITIFGLRF